MSFLTFFRSQMEDILIRLKVTRIELAKIQADLERLLILDRNIIVSKVPKLKEIETALGLLKKTLEEGEKRDKNEEDKL